MADSRDAEAFRCSVEQIEDIADSVAREFVGRNVVSVDQIASRIAWFKDKFRNGGSPQLYESIDSAIAYLHWYTPRYMRALLDIMMRLAHCGLIPTSPRVLDIGAGCGTSTLALAAFLSIIHQRRTAGIDPAKWSGKKLSADVVPVDVSPVMCELNTKIGESIAQRMPYVELNATPYICDVRDPQLTEKVGEKGPFDIVILSNVLNELGSEAEQKRLVRMAGDMINDRGTVIVIEPAVQSSFRQACFEVCREAPFDDGLSVFGPCFHDCRFSGECWAYLRGAMGWGQPQKVSRYYRGFTRRLVMEQRNPEKFLEGCWPVLEGSAEFENPESNSLPWSSTKEYRYSVLLLRKDDLRSSPPVSTEAHLASAIGKRSIDIRVLVASYVPIGDGWYSLCDGIYGPNFVWLSASSFAASQPLQVGRVYRIRSDSASWGRGVGSKCKYSLSLYGSESSVEVVSCHRKAVDVGTRFVHEKLGPVTVQEGPSRGCRSNVKMCVEYDKTCHDFNLGFCFDRLILRLV